jgi:hypothetical protein
LREAGLHLVVADLVVAGEALRARAARADERHGDALAHRPSGHVGADLVDGARELVARHMRQLDVAVVAHPAVPVAAAQAGRLHADDRPARRTFRPWHVDDGGDDAELTELDGAHGSDPASSQPPGTGGSSVTSPRNV